MTDRSATIMVAYGISEVDLDWVPSDQPVFIVHNDDRLPVSGVRHPAARHLHPGSNLGFGAAVNLALTEVEEERVVLCNPDLALRRQHWDALQADSPDEVRTVALADGLGRPTAVVNPYPTPLATLATGLRAGRLLHRGTLVRRLLAGSLLGAWGREHEQLQRRAEGTWPLATHWVSGALASFDTARLRAVGGFDSGYFLYMEDVDLCRRLSLRFPTMTIRMVATSPAIHQVGGSARSGDARRVAENLRLASARRYVAGERGLGWRLVGAALQLRARLRAGSGD